MKQSIKPLEAFDLNGGQSGEREQVKEGLSGSWQSIRSDAIRCSSKQRKSLPHPHGEIAPCYTHI